jgi:hypothetical protein
VAEIPNFPEGLLHLHHAWHRPWDHPELPGRLVPYPNPGSGAEFLIFHRDFMRKFHVWYDSQPFADSTAVAPWTAIPAEMRLPEFGWNQVTIGQERRIVTNSPAFVDFDELGIFIEGGIHNNFLHTAAADVYHDELVRPPAMSPRSTLFYKIHGLVNHWWLLRFPATFTLKTGIDKSELDTPPKHTTFEIPTKTGISKAELDTPPKHITFEVPTKTGISKAELDTPPKHLAEKPLTKVEIAELVGKRYEIPGQMGEASDTAVLGSLITGIAQRLDAVEEEVARGTAFIRSTERPSTSAGDASDGREAGDEQ